MKNVHWDLSKNIEFRPYATTHFVGTGQPTCGYWYRSPTGTMWNVDSIKDDIVSLWTVNAWNQTHWLHIPRPQFETRWGKVDRI